MRLQAFLRADLDAEGGFELDPESTASVEISWDGVINRRFFAVPDVCHLLAKSSKDRLVTEIDRSNPENKLIDFLTRAKDLYREVKHQEWLEERELRGSLVAPFKTMPRGSHSSSLHL